ncbi:MAG: hypothetical protein J5803_01300, partial [Desulfovibrio sp.]|nr:hypothetical protein [Desulfovibrio sp.]
MTLATWKKWYLCIMTIFFFCYLTIILVDIRPFSQYGNLFGLVGIDLGLCAFLIGIRAHKRRTRLPWFFFALTALCSMIGQGLWSYYDHILGIPTQSPALPDLFKISYVLFCIAGIATFLRRNKVSLASFSADLVISLIAAGGFIYIFLIAPALEGATEITSALVLK